MNQMSDKNLSILKDGLTGEAIACKKCIAYSTMATDQCVKALFSNMAQHHRDNFLKLLDYLNAN